MLIAPEHVLLVQASPRCAGLVSRALAQVAPLATLHVARSLGAGLASVFGLVDRVTGKRASPGLILLDAELPEHGAEELLRALRRNPATQHIPVLVTGEDVPPARARVLAGLGANGFVSQGCEACYPAMLYGIVMHWHALERAMAGQELRGSH